VTNVPPQWGSQPGQQQPGQQPILPTPGVSVGVWYPLTLRGIVQAPTSTILGMAAPEYRILQGAQGLEVQLRGAAQVRNGQTVLAESGEVVEGAPVPVYSQALDASAFSALFVQQSIILGLTSVGRGGNGTIYLASSVAVTEKATITFDGISYPLT
jgi:hypothetical protein